MSYRCRTNRCERVAEIPLSCATAELHCGDCLATLWVSHTNCRAIAPPDLAKTDWLHHRLTVCGAAAWAGIISRGFGFERLQEDWFHRQMVPWTRTLSAAGTRVLAGWLRDATERRHALAVDRVCHGQACPSGLRALLLTVPADILRLGPETLQALAWLWQHWGSTQALAPRSSHPAPQGFEPLVGWFTFQAGIFGY